jgi:type 1 glutamine amidotransferase
MGPALLLGALALAAATLPAAAQTREERVLVFTKTAGFRHESIPAAVAALQALAERNGLILDHTEDADVFTEEELGRYGAVVFANTTGDVLDERQQQAFERYVEGGGGYMGIHAASDTEYDWPWYGALVGAWFKGHPPGLQTGTVTFADPLREGGPRAWRVTDEFYNFQANPRPQVTVLATLDEGTYSGGEMGRDHPIAWCRTVGSGRSWYTGLGHRAELYADPTFLAHLERGLLFAVGRAECG